VTLEENFAQGLLFLASSFYGLKNYDLHHEYMKEYLILSKRLKNQGMI
jgi:hypothetical protein